MSDYNGARLIVDALPPAKHLLADRGYDADWFREALQEKGIEPCIPSRKNRKREIRYDTAAGFTSQVQLLGFRGTPRRAFDSRGIFGVLS
jgi:transposase